MDDCSQYLHVPETRVCGGKGYCYNPNNHTGELVVVKCPEGAESSTGGCIFPKAGDPFCVCDDGWSSFGDFSLWIGDDCDIYAVAVQALWSFPLVAEFLLGVVAARGFQLLIKRKKMTFTYWRGFLQLESQLWFLSLLSSSLWVIVSCQKIYDPPGFVVGLHRKFTIFFSLTVFVNYLFLTCAFVVFLRLLQSSSSSARATVEQHQHNHQEHNNNNHILQQVEEQEHNNEEGEEEEEQQQQQQQVDDDDVDQHDNSTNNFFNQFFSSCCFSCCCRISDISILYCCVGLFLMLTTFASTTPTFMVYNKILCLESIQAFFALVGFASLVLAFGWIYMMQKLIPELNLLHEEQRQANHNKSQARIKEVSDQLRYVIKNFSIIRYTFFFTLLLLGGLCFSFGVLRFFAKKTAYIFPIYWGLLAITETGLLYSMLPRNAITGAASREAVVAHGYNRGQLSELEDEGKDSVAVLSTVLERGESKLINGTRVESSVA